VEVEVETMKLLVEKQPHGIRLRITYDESKKPLEVILNPGQLESILSLLASLNSVEKATVEVSL
jgi:hypothetical protein